MIWLTVAQCLPADIEREVVGALQQTVINPHKFRPEREPNTRVTAAPLTFYFEHAIGGLSCVYRRVHNPGKPESCWCLHSNDEPESSTNLDDKVSGKKMKGKKTKNQKINK